MTDPTPEKPVRRPRYRGPNPRRFDEKYKELRPDLYPAEQTKAREGGRTPAGTHRPILVGEILEVLDLRPGSVVVDATLGYGGHAREILARIQPGGRLIGVDADPVELPRTEARLRDLGYPEGSVVVRRMNFAGLAPMVGAEAPGGVDAILADLGLSSMQVDNPSRGFTFKADGPLDMRMNPGKGRSASDLLSTIGEAGLARILEENADEPEARVLASAILRTHARSPIRTTGTLGAVVRSAIGRLSRPEGSADDSVRRVFQALRIAVNDEFGSIDALLRGLPTALKPGGRVAILSFHSGEDRRVKSAFRDGLAAGIYAAISPEPIRASAEERRANPRSTSAKLRWAVRASEPIRLPFVDG